MLNDDDRVDCSRSAECSGRCAFLLLSSLILPQGADINSTGEWKTLPAPLEHINLHIRGGYILPWQQHALNTQLRWVLGLGLCFAYCDLILLWRKLLYIRCDSQGQMQFPKHLLFFSMSMCFALFHKWTLCSYLWPECAKAAAGMWWGRMLASFAFVC